MSGTWYGVEILDHVTKGRPIVDTCIKVNIRQQENNYIELEWKERDFVVTYKFRILDQTRRGKWTSQGSQSGKNEEPLKKILAEVHSNSNLSSFLFFYNGENFKLNRLFVI